MGNDIPEQPVEGDAQARAGTPSIKQSTSTGAVQRFPRRWSKRTVLVAAAVVVGVAAAGALTVFVIDQLTRVEVPSVEDDALTDATTAIETIGLEVKVVSDSNFCRASSMASSLCVVSSQTPTSPERVHAGTTVVLDVVPAEVTVSNFVGLSYREASLVAADLGLAMKLSDTSDSRVEGYEDWEVIDQSDRGRMKAGSGLTVTLERPLVDAPSVIGVSLSDAMDRLIAAGFTPVVPVAIPGSTYDGAWVVTETDPALVDGKLPLESKVTLTWSVRVPDVVGMTDLAADSTLSNAHLGVVGSRSSSRNVVAQNPAAGTLVELDADVTITLDEETVVYEVVGNGNRASITWIAPGTYNISQATDAVLPWRMTFQTGASYRNFNAQIMDGDSVTCNIYINGKLLKTNTSTGQYAVVACG